MTAVADSGPLMALAKVGGLYLLDRLFPRIVVPPAVFAETVTAGQQLLAPDSSILAVQFRGGRIEVKEPGISSLPIPAKLGPGEDESIRLAIELGADWLLVDDHDARTHAERCFRAAGTGTRVKGTLGVIVSAYQQELLPRDEALALLSALHERPDIWLSRRLVLLAMASLKS